MCADGALSLVTAQNERLRLPEAQILHVNPCDYRLIGLEPISR